jgi:cbb3-type cytochrome oxidase subunit 3
MIRLVMERAGLTFWPVFSFVLFLVSSIAILVWLYRPGSAAFYMNLAKLALDDDRPPARKD